MEEFSSYDIISIQNIDDEDFIFDYDKSKGGYSHVIPAGEVKRLPRFLANHGLKHLIDKIIMKKYHPKKRINDKILRSELASQIVIGEEVFQKPPEKSKAVVLQEKIDKLNRPSELDSILEKRRKKDKEEKEKIGLKPNMDEPQKPVEKFEGLKEEVVDVTPKVEKEVKPLPTRNEIYKYAERSLNMVIEEKEKKKFNKMKVADLLVEIGDPRLAVR